MSYAQDYVLLTCDVFSVVDDASIIFLQDFVVDRPVRLERWIARECRRITGVLPHLFTHLDQLNGVIGDGRKRLEL